jgi:hypothetical protein
VHATKIAETTYLIALFENTAACNNRFTGGGSSTHINAANSPRSTSDISHSTAAALAASNAAMSSSGRDTTSTSSSTSVRAVPPLPTPAPLQPSISRDGAGGGHERRDSLLDRYY